MSLSGKNNPIVSIIIPVYNVSQYIEKCLISCINQTFKLIEIIVVNDGSTDSSLKIVERYASIDSRITIINKKNEGLLWARKSGLDIAKGEYVFHLDGDDYIEDNTIEILYGAVKSQEGISIVVGGIVVDSFIGQLKNNIQFCKPGKYSSSQFLNIMIDNYAWTIWGRLIKREYYNNVHFFQMKREDQYVKGLPIGEDTLQMLQLCRLADSVLVIENKLYHYVQRPHSIMNSLNNEINALRQFEFAFVINKLRQELKWNKEVDVKLVYLSLEKLLFYLRVIGQYGKDKSWIRNFVKQLFLQNKSNRKYVWKKNKMIYLQLIILFYLSPKASKLIHSLRNRICQ